MPALAATSANLPAGGRPAPQRRRRWALRTHRALAAITLWRPHPARTANARPARAPRPRPPRRPRWGTPSRAPLDGALRPILRTTFERFQRRAGTRRFPLPPRSARITSSRRPAYPRFPPSARSRQPHPRCGWPATAGLPCAMHPARSRPEPLRRHHHRGRPAAPTPPRRSRSSAPGCRLVHPTRAEPAGATAHRETSGTHMRACGKPTELAAVSIGVASTAAPRRNGEAAVPFPRTGKLAVPSRCVRARSLELARGAASSRALRRGCRITSTHQHGFCFVLF